LGTSASTPGTLRNSGISTGGHSSVRCAARSRTERQIPRHLNQIAETLMVHDEHAPAADIFAVPFRAAEPRAYVPSLIEPMAFELRPRGCQIAVPRQNVAARAVRFERIGRCSDRTPGGSQRIGRAAGTLQREGQHPGRKRSDEARRPQR
jgi:hypothetical protein